MATSYPIHDPRHPEHEQMRRRIVRKMDWHILPAISLLYLACFLDRSNIGNAKVAGLGKDLDLTGVRFNISLTVFYITYILVELPSNLLLRRFGAKTWLPLLVFCWGVTTIMAAFIKNFASLVAIRLLLGFFEGGVLPGIILYLCTIYRKDELQLRIGLFFSCSSWSGAFGGLLAYAIEGMDGIGGKPSWGWIFIIEGLATIVVAAIARFFLFSSLSSATFLNPAEKHFAENRLNFDYYSWRQPRIFNHEGKLSNLKPTNGVEESEKLPSQDPYSTMYPNVHGVEHFEWAEVRRGFLEPQVWILGFSLMFSTVGTYSFSFFLPTLVKEMGNDRVHAQLLSAYPYLPASLLVVIVALIADKWQVRGPIVLACLPVAITGYLLAGIAGSERVRYASVFLIAAGIFPTGPCFFTLLPNNTGGITKRATVTALQIMIANLSGFISPWIYTQDQAPRFVKGHLIMFGFVCISWVLTACNVLYCWKENLARKAGHRDQRKEKYHRLLSDKKTQAPIGDRDPAFLYTL